MEHEARPTDGLPETAPNCEAMISKAKATERELIRTPVIHDRESQFIYAIRLANGATNWKYDIGSLLDVQVPITELLPAP